jgi:AbrB family looped-hinge helix DNA binding protein
VSLAEDSAHLLMKKLFGNTFSFPTTFVIVSSPVNIYMNTSTVTPNGRITIPVHLRKKYSIKPRTKVAFIEKDGEIVIKPLTKQYFISFAGILKGDVMGELMKEKKHKSEQ